MGSLLLVLVFSLNYVSLHFLLKACLSAREHSYIGLSGRTSVRALPPSRRHQQRPHARTPARPHARTPARPHARTWRAVRAAREALRLPLAGLGGGARRLGLAALFLRIVRLVPCHHRRRSRLKSALARNRPCGHPTAPETCPLA
jgi:hypothetical protein